ncbi:MAG TPA: ABC transporter permease [Candidatus Norongarragalinales archaeon]|nr:ABC transporter permease [Candidatus Norongarragalinales archaeon]
MVAVLQLFKLALNNLSERRLRSLLTIIGIFIGITAVVALMSLGDGLQNVVVGQFSSIGADKITIMGSNGFAASPFVSASLPNPITTDDLRVVSRTRGVQEAGGMLFISTKAEYKKEVKNTFLLGLPEDDTRALVEEGQNIEVSEGRTLKTDDKGVIVIGSYTSDGLFKRKIYVGETLKIEGKDFKVVGILKTRGSRFDDDAIYMNGDEARALTNKPELESIIMARFKKGESPEKVAAAVAENLRKHRNVEKGSEDFVAQTSEQLAQSFATILGVVQGVIVGIAAISLLVGGIGIMNTMYTSVVERTKEIGLMKAVGARNSDITLLFLFESGLLGLLGGVVGVLIGIGLSKIAEVAVQQALSSNSFVAIISPELIAGALLFGFVIGTASGVLPARRAASLKPAVALRYE